MIRTPGEHIPNIKNRSSKHLIQLTKVRYYLRSVNNEQLSKWSSGGWSDARKELNRRSAKHSKKSI